MFTRANTGPHPEPLASSPHPYPLLLPSKYYPPIMPRSPMYSLLLGLQNDILHALLLSLMLCKCPSYLILFDQITVVMCSGVQIMDLLIVLFFQPLVTSSQRQIFSVPCYFINLNLLSSLGMRDRFHTHTEQQAKLWLCIF
jgi:hypothetical protein